MTEMGDLGPEVTMPTKVDGTPILPHQQEWKASVEGRPDKTMVLARQIDDKGVAIGPQSVGLEWSTAGKKVDLTREATQHGFPRHTLIQVEGSDKPAFLMGRGYIIDIETSLRDKKLHTLHLAQQIPNGGQYAVTLGDPLWPDGPSVTRLLQEDVGGSSVEESTKAESDGGTVLSPFVNVEAKLHTVLSAREQAGTVIPPEVSSLISR